MVQPGSLPSVVIVGRPNVGKSTLFNTILGQRRAIVGDEPGITRDRIRGVAEHHGRRFELIDTGGIVPNEDDLIPSEIFRQARVALDQADQIVFLIDGRTEITAADRDLVQHLQRLGKPLSLAVNKIDSVARESLAHEFWSLGIQHLFPVSAEHRIGLEELLDHVTAGFEKRAGEEEEAKPPHIKVAIIGRPNVGKSTLLNALVGEERAIVSPIAGTTRDAVDETVARDGVDYVFVDTAGIRRKGKTKLMAEKLSVVMARRHIRLANVVILVLDASEGLVGLDATIAGYAHEEGRAVIVVVNKWDATREKRRKVFLQAVRDELKFLDYAPALFLSAKTGSGVEQLFPRIKGVFEAASQRVATGELNRFVDTLEFERDFKLKYITQASVRPPTFILFTDRKRDLHFSTQRYLINRIRERFGFEGTPIVVKLKAPEKPR
ncbi:MAG TPA: ribosome biogenesis GTPase Der [Solibacterales bacterium]|nr:ribosome biogenesis GTPase Der [Bryobacterales bacterium]